MATLAEYYGKELTTDLAWREAELAVMRKQLLLTTPKGLQEQVMLRANVAMIYAHYEGFCKFALETYIDALVKLKLKRIDLTWALATHSLNQLQTEMNAESERREFFSRLFSTFNSQLEVVADYERPPQIANLWPDLLINWLSKLGLAFTNVASNHAHLESLVTNRNQIAHGKKLTISSRTDLDKYANAALLAMHEVAIEVVNALDTKSYKRLAVTQTILNHAL